MNNLINYNTSAKMVKILIAMVVLESLLIFGYLAKIRIKNPYKTLEEALRDSIRGRLKWIKNQKNVINIGKNNLQNRNIAINYTYQTRNVQGSISLRKGNHNLTKARLLAEHLIEIINKGSNVSAKYQIMNVQDIKGGSYSHVFKLMKGNNTSKIYILKFGDVSDNEWNIIKNKRLIKENVIPKCYGYFNTNVLIAGTKKNMRGYIQEYAGESLGQYVLRNPYFRLSPDDFRNLLIKLLKFHYITGCYHGDLYEGNIVVFQKRNGSLDFKLIDFGKSFYTPRHCVNVGKFAKYIPNIKNLSDNQILNLVQRLEKSSEFERITSWYPMMNVRKYRKLAKTNNLVLSNFNLFRRMPTNRSMKPPSNTYQTQFG